MLYTIIAIAVVAFLICLCFIFWDNVKAFVKKIFYKKPKNVPQGEPLKPSKEEPSNDEFIPLKNQFDDSERDASLEALLAEDDDYMVDDSFFDEPITPSKPTLKQEMLTDDFESLLSSRMVSSRNSNKKTISKQIKELPPEIKALLVDSVLKKRDDV